jgi:hypothetical protein
MVDLLDALLEALSFAFGMFWEILPPLAGTPSTGRTPEPG